MINRVILMGHLSKDPELRYSSNGIAVSTFTLAVNRPKVNGSEQQPDWINIVAWRQLGENCANYLKKGSKAAVEGRLQTRSYDNKEGKRVYVTEVVAENVQFLSGRDGGRSEHSSGSADSRSNDYDRFNDPFADAGKPINISDDDLPFKLGTLAA